MRKKSKKSKEVRLKDNLTRVVKEFVTAKKNSLLTPRQVLEKLSLPEEHLDIIIEIFFEMNRNVPTIDLEDEPVVEKETPSCITGTIRMHPKGFGFVVTDKGFDLGGDIFIPKNLTKNAIDGDKVEVALAEGPISEKGPEGRVTLILERSRKHLAGTVISLDPSVEVYSPLLGANQRIYLEKTGKTPLSIGDRIVMEMIEWGSKETPAKGKWLNTIGNISDPKTDIPAAIEEFGLSSSFPKKALKESLVYGTRVKPSDLEGRLDLRNEFTCTIDPDTAKDFDDAISISSNKTGYKLGVHIADVSHYVKPLSALDQEAIKRGNSTYFPGVCLPMLPKELSENLCSLKPNCVRLTYSVIMDFDTKGELKKYTIQKSAIKSAKRLTYKQAKRLLDKDEKTPLTEKLKLMVKLAKLLKQKRIDRGSVDLALPDFVVKVNEEGEPTGTEIVEYDITHQMIEEFMLKANETTAAHLTSIGKSVAYRVHDVPQEENIQEFALMARSFGFEIEDNPSPHLIQKLFEKASQTSYGEYLATNYIRRMRMAYYSPENIGHYGLSLEHYCHFTSPIRRFADLIIHRQLADEFIDEEHLEKITSNLSDRERLSAKAEQSVIQLKKLRYLDNIKKNEPNKQFKAVVTSVKPFGLTIDILDIMLETFVHISEIGLDYYEFNERKRELVGRSTGEIFTTGTTVLAHLHKVDLITLETQWELITEVPDPKRERSHKRQEGYAKKNPSKYGKRSKRRR